MKSIFLTSQSSVHVMFILLFYQNQLIRLIRKNLKKSEAVFLKIKTQHLLKSVRICLNQTHPKMALKRKF